MKKALAILAGLLVVVAAIVFTNRRTGAGGLGAKFSIARASELAPVDATFFLAMPDVERVAPQWKAKGLGLIGPMPLGGPWRDYLEKNSGTPEDGPSPALFEDLARIQAEGFFYATVPGGEGGTELVGGLSYRGKKSEVDGAIRLLKEMLFAGWAGAKSELSSEHGIEIESITSSDEDGAAGPPAPSAHFAFRDNWVFLATNRALLAGTLARYAHVAGAGRGLAEEPSFAECRQHALPEADLCLWAGNFDGRHSGDLRAVHYECQATHETGGRVYLQFGELRASAGIETAADERWREFIRTGVSVDDALRPAIVFQSVAPLRTPFETELLLGPEFPVAFHQWARRAFPDYVIAIEVRDAAQAFRIGEGIVEEERREILLEQGRETLWDWGPWGDRQGRVALAPQFLDAPLVLGRKPANGLDSLGMGNYFGTPRRQLRLPSNYSRFVVSKEGSFYYMEIPALWEFVPAQGSILRYEPWLLTRAWIREIFSHQSPATLRVRRHGEGWVVESDLNVLGLDLINAALRGQP